MTRCVERQQPVTDDAGDPLVWPRISIVIPSYNQGRFIADAIESVLSQNYPDLELMVMDGGSTDETVEVLGRYDDRLAWWVSEPDGGQSEAINTALTRATGGVLGWLCTDDMLTEGALHAVGRHFAAHPDCQWLSGTGEIVYLETGKRSCGASSIASPTALMEFWKWGADGHYVCQPSTFWTPDLWAAAEGLRNDNHLAMDYELWLRFQPHATMETIDRLLSISRIHPECKSDSNRTGQIRETMRCAYAAARIVGIGRVGLTARLLRSLMARRWGRLVTNCRARWITGTIAETFKLLGDPLLVWSERGRMITLRHV